MPDTCLALSRRCWAFDMADRPETRPEIEPHTWTHSSANPPASPERAGSRWRAGQLAWPVSSKEKADLIIFDPPYFEAFFALLKLNAKKTTRLAFINADWRDFQSKPAAEESGKGAILIDDYLRILNKTGW